MFVFHFSSETKESIKRFIKKKKKKRQVKWKDVQRGEERRKENERKKKEVVLVDIHLFWDTKAILVTFFIES